MKRIIITLLMLMSVVYGQTAADSVHLKPMTPMSQSYSLLQFLVRSNARFLDSVEFRGVVYAAPPSDNDSSRRVANTDWIRRNIAPGLPGSPSLAWTPSGNTIGSSGRYLLGSSDNNDWELIANGVRYLHVPKEGIRRTTPTGSMKVLMIDTTLKIMWYADYPTGSGSGSNFANADLTATGNRTHDFANFGLTINNLGFTHFNGIDDIFNTSDYALNKQLGFGNDVAGEQAILYNSDNGATGRSAHVSATLTDAEIFHQRTSADNPSYVKAFGNKAVVVSHNAYSGTPTDMAVWQGDTLKSKPISSISFSIDTSNITNFWFKVRSLFSASSPLTYSNGLFGIQTASTSQAGAISAADWNTFNNKVSFTSALARAAISLTTTGTGAATYNSTTGVLNIPTPSAAPYSYTKAPNATYTAKSTDQTIDFLDIASSQALVLSEDSLKKVLLVGSPTYSVPIISSGIRLADGTTPSSLPAKTTYHLKFNSTDHYWQEVSPVNKDSVVTPTQLSDTLAHYYTQAEVDSAINSRLTIYNDSIAALQPLILTGFLTQSGTDAPDFTILKNTTGSTFSLLYISNGVYRIKSGVPGLFTSDKTLVFIGNGVVGSGGGLQYCNYHIIDTDYIEIRSTNEGASVDGVLDHASIRIEIYP